MKFGLNPLVIRGILEGRAPARPRTTRRSSFQRGAVTVAAALLFATACGPSAHATEKLPVPDRGWHLWPDTQAAWKDDTVYLPGDFDLGKLPVNPPTGGWNVLDDGSGIEVTLPSTVEQHDWGKFGLRPYTPDEYYYAKNDKQVFNGNYEGVSWWWREMKVPASFRGKVVLLRIRGARQRAEVYVNRHLVGYDLIAETAFTCDVGKALCPGEKNQIAIRITSPGGRLDWNDGGVITWGNAKFQESHGFGGLDRGMTLAAHDPVYISDAWALNTQEARTITGHAILRNTTDQPQTGSVSFSVIDPTTGSSLAAHSVPATVAARADATFECPVSVPGAKLWDLDSPRLYTLHLSWSTKIPDSKTERVDDTSDVTFGFRWFEPRGIGNEAGLYLNGKRIRLYSAISWGFWGLNGLWPTPELAEKEVRAAKRLNMNCLNFHRDIGKEEVLAQQDKLGLLRYMEPGGGIQVLGDPFPKSDHSPNGPVDVSGKGGDPSTFAERYMEAKILRMIRQFRSHPSLVIYNLHNEMEPDFSNPHLFNILNKMHAEDPSRIILAKSGISPRLQAWFDPDQEAILRDDGTGFSGWRDEHTVGGPGVWTDSLYQDPQNFTHRIDDRREIVDWGEMLGAPSPDHHKLMIGQILARGATSYDLKDHQELAKAYEDYLDKWGFHAAFPTAEKLFSSAGDKAYEFWGRVIETARLCESNDMFSMSGWESTAIEDHGGIVDNLRNFKGNPDLISAKLAPLLPVVEPRQSVYRAGDTATLDLYLLNETGHAAEGTVDLTLQDPDGHRQDLGKWPAPPYQADHFVYPVKMALVTPPLKLGGSYKLLVRLTGKTPAENSETVLVIQPTPPGLHETRIGFLGTVPDVLKELQAIPQLTVETYRPEGKYDVLVAPQEPSGRIVHFDNGAKIQNTDDDALYHSSIRGRPENLRFNFDHLPSGPAKVSLYFSEPVFTEKDKRVFDVEINGQTVLKDFDIIAEAGGQNSAVVKTFDINITDGSLVIRPSHVVDHGVSENTRGEALFNAIKVEVGGKVIAVDCGGEPYQDKSGVLWQPYVPRAALDAAIFKRVKSGLPLLVIASDSGTAESAARRLADAGAFQFGGMIPSVRAPWMGNWVFLRDHPTYAGLPVNEVMKGDYQIPVGNCYGLIVDGPTVRVIAVYGRDHDRNIGAVTFTAKLGCGTVLFQALKGMNPLMEQRWLGNAIQWLSQSP